MSDEKDSVSMLRALTEKEFQMLAAKQEKILKDHYAKQVPALKKIFPTLGDRIARRFTNGPVQVGKGSGGVGSVANEQSEIEKRNAKSAKLRHKEETRRIVESMEKRFRQFQ